MTTYCYVRVYNNDMVNTYDVGPFNHSGNEPAFQTESAINWIYKQIGIIKTLHPDSPLTKHKWSYVKDDFLGPRADVKIEIHNITFEIFNLVSPDSHNVVDEHTTYEYPTWMKTEIDNSDDNA